MSEAETKAYAAAVAANNRQVGGEHYRSAIQHWDFVASNNLDYFQGQVTKYVTRWKLKAGIQDLHKAMHFLQKYIELEQQKIADDMGTARADWSHPRSGVTIPVDRDAPNYGVADAQQEQSPSQVNASRSPQS